MQIILNHNVEGLGAVGDVLKVKDGYARNYLIPKGLAVTATSSNVRVVEKIKVKEIEVERDKKAIAEELAKKILSVTLTLEAKAGEDGKLFGSISAGDIQEVLNQQDLVIDRKNILLKQPIKKTGSYSVEIRCYTNLKATLKFSVVNKQD